MTHLLAGSIDWRAKLMIYGCRPELGSHELVDLIGTQGTAGRLCLVFMDGKCWLDRVFSINFFSLLLSISPVSLFAFCLKGGWIELD